MQIDSLMMRYADTVTALWQRSLTRYREAKAGIDDGSYTSDRLARDLLGGWFDLASAGLELNPLAGRTSLPYIAIDAQLALPADKGGSAFLDTPIDMDRAVAVGGVPAPRPALYKTDLVRVGGTETIAESYVDAQPQANNAAILIVSVDHQSAPGLVEGVYQGFVYQGTRPLAGILLYLY